MRIDKQIALQLIERAAELNIKGVKRDKMAMEFVIGATCAARLLGQDEASKSLRSMAIMMQFRGFSIIADYSKVSEGFASEAGEASAAAELNGRN